MQGGSTKRDLDLIDFSASTIPTWQKAQEEVSRRLGSRRASAHSRPIRLVLAQPGIWTYALLHDERSTVHHDRRVML